MCGTSDGTAAEMMAGKDARVTSSSTICLAVSHIDGTKTNRKFRKTHASSVYAGFP
jgi:hypothetical protein